MRIVGEEIKKAGEIFKALEFSAGKAKEHEGKLRNAILMDMAAEALAEKGMISDDMSFSEEEVEDFLLDNYEESELEEINKRVARDVVVEYVSKLLKDAPEEKISQVESILDAKF